MDGASLQEERPWVARLARAGMLAPGVLYVVVGVLAIQVALGRGGANPSRQGALHAIAGGTWGTIALVLLAVGFGGYALWRFAAAALGEKVESREDVEGWKRLWYVGRGVGYSVACFTTVKVLTGGGGSSDTQSQRRHTAEVLDWPGGRWLVAAVGIGVIGYGAGSAYRGIARTFADDLDLHELGARSRRWVCRAGVFGWVARGVVLALIGVFLVKAAVEFDPRESKGLDAALATLAGQPFGPLLLGVVAAGLIAFGLFYGVRARYRRV